MHARIAAHNGRARSYGMSAPDSCLLRCVRCKCATRACVMRCVRARKHYRRRCLGRGGKARRRRGMIHAPCLRDQGGRPAGRPAGGGGGGRGGGGGGGPRGGAGGGGGGVRGRGPRAAAVARGAGLYSMAGECGMPIAESSRNDSNKPNPSTSQGGRLHTLQLAARHAFPRGKRGSHGVIRFQPSRARSSM
jgi:hypothetical protein